MNQSSQSWSRRNFIGNTGRFAAISATAAAMGARVSAAEEVAAKAGAEGAVNHSVCKWCYGKIPLEDLCVAAKDIGLQSIELLNPPELEVLKKHDLVCALVTSPRAMVGEVEVGGIEKAFNRLEFHDALVESYENCLKECKEAGANQLICFSGNRDGMDDEVGLKNCATGLKRLMPMAEKLGIVITMELLNSRVDHKDYMCDHSDWGVALCKEVGSDNFKLLYDIYHMQIMEGDLIATIKEDHQYFSHYHTGGVPGRHEIDDSQEIYYPAVMRAIVDTGFKGFVAQEFIPAREDALASLKQGVEICSV